MSGIVDQSPGVGFIAGDEVGARLVNFIGQGEQGGGLSIEMTTRADALCSRLGRSWMV